MIRALALALLLPLSSAADEDRGASFAAKDANGNVVHIYSTPCPDTAPWLHLREAQMNYQGKDYKACWTLLGGYVVIFDDSGDVTPIPQEMFKKDEAL